MSWRSRFEENPVAEMVAAGLLGDGGPFDTERGKHELDETAAMEARPGDGYCDLCEVEGHTFRTCPRRDDSTSETP